MSARHDIASLAAGLIDGSLAENDLPALDHKETSILIAHLIERAEGRRWLRASRFLTPELAARLIEYADDFSQSRFDATLEGAVRAADIDIVIAHAAAIAAGAGAPALWARLAGDEVRLRAAFDRIRKAGRAVALEATATHLLLDPAEQYGISNALRTEIATTIVDSDVDAARAVAAEFLAGTAPDLLATRLDRLAYDASASVRAIAWSAAFRANREWATGRAVELLGDEKVDAAIRRSALNVAGEALPTAEMIGLLSYFVVHPNRNLALDAASLLHRHHRHPEIAIAAAGSPHDEVRAIANRLMDPYRGSPAAGGSRPGDPLRADPLMQLLRQLEEETEE